MTCSDKIARWNALGIQGGLLCGLCGPLYIKSITTGRKFSFRHSTRALCCRLQDFSSSCGRFRIHHPALISTSVKFDTSVIFTVAPVEQLTHTAIDSDSKQSDDTIVAVSDSIMGSGVDVVHVNKSSSASTGDVAIGASFEQVRCLYWFASSNNSSIEGTYGVLDGKTGLLESGAPSHICRSALLSQAEIVMSFTQGEGAFTHGEDYSSYANMKGAGGLFPFSGRYAAAKDELLAADKGLFAGWCRDR